MKIKLVNDLGVWLDGARRGEGYETEIDDAQGKTLINLRLAEEIKPAPAKKAAKK